MDIAELLPSLALIAASLVPTTMVPPLPSLEALYQNLFGAHAPTSCACARERPRTTFCPPSP